MIKTKETKTHEINGHNTCADLPNQLTIAVSKHNIGTLSPEFQRHSLQVSGGHCVDELTYFRTSCESHFVHVVVGGNGGSSCGSVARDDVHNA